MMDFPWHLYVMAALYLLAGLNHFRNPRMYERIIPTYLPNPKILNFASGFAEIILGIGLMIPAFSELSAWGIIFLLIAIFPSNVFMFTDQKASFGLPKWFLFLRLVLQIPLILWAYLYI